MKGVVSLVVFAALSPVAHSQSSSTNIRGFLMKDIPDEQKLEQQAQAVPDPGRMRQYMNFMAGEPHHAGSPRSKAVAEYLLGSLKGWGLDAAYRRV